MLIRNGRAFARGIILLVSFIVVFILFFMPIFPPQEDGGKNTNGLVFADHLFNTLSKGSANFLDPTLQKPDSVDKSAQRVEGKTVDVEVPFQNPAQQELARSMLSGLGFTVAPSQSGLKIKGDLYAMLKAALADSLSTYNNDFEEVSGRHNGNDGREVMKTWWSLMNGMIKPMQKANMVDEAAVVFNVMIKAVEPSYNFYGITPLKVADNIPLVAGFLIFYVIYTMWYGFAIFELFDGIGLSMKKSVKQEV